MIANLLRVALLALAVMSRAHAAAGPVFSDGGPDAEGFGAAQGFPPPPTAEAVTQATAIGFYSRYDRVVPTRAVPTSAAASQLRRAAEEIVPVYQYDGRQKTIGDYLAEHPVTGLLVARDDTILFEHYQYARTDRDRMLSNSMAKTIAGMLVGIAVAEGAIRSIEDPAATYVPELAGTEYGVTPIRALLHMSSGVAFRETYQPGDDISTLHAALLGKDGMGAIEALRPYSSRIAPPGTRFAYASAETEVLGLVVSRAVKMPLADYLAARIWRKLGAESDAAWAIDPGGQELAYCCLIATLRDWARLGLMMAHDGAWNGQQIVPRQWLLDATTVAPGDDYLRNTIAPSWGYGYQVWLMPGERRMFLLLGIFGQALFVDPQSKLVMVQTAIRRLPIGDPKAPESLALWYAIVDQHGRR